MAQEWKFEYCHGEKAPNEEAVEGDIISSIDFDDTGNYLALGDRAGRVTILERKRSRGVSEYRLHTRFQSHEPEFDYLKSVEIEEKINQIRWLKPTCAAQMLLSTNDKTIKLWKVHERRSTSVLTPSNPTSAEIRIPQLQHTPYSLTHSQRRVFANAHAYHINSISLNSDSETFISADDLRINLWHLDHKESLNIVDIKPANMEDLTEVITSASFHPRHCSLFIYSTSKGTMKMGDLRDGSTCEAYSKVFDVEEDAANKTFFSEIISSISDSKFSNDGRYLLSRDYLTLKIWDTNMERRPLKVLTIHEALRSRLCDLYENDCIFDKFECAWSGDSKYSVTGSYKNQFKIHDVRDVTNPGSSGEVRASGTIPQLPLTMEAVKVQPKNKKKGTSLGSIARSKLSGTRKKMSISDEQYEKADFNRKILHLACHPTDHEIGVAAVNCCYIFSSPGSGDRNGSV